MQQQKVVVFSDGLFFKPNLTENELGNCMFENRVRMNANTNQNKHTHRNFLNSLHHYSEMGAPNGSYKFAPHRPFQNNSSPSSSTSLYFTFPSEK